MRSACRKENSVLRRSSHSGKTLSSQSESSEGGSWLSWVTSSRRVSPRGALMGISSVERLRRSSFCCSIVSTLPWELVAWQATGALGFKTDEVLCYQGW